MHTFLIPPTDMDFVDLPEEEVRHAVQVLRLKKGDPIRLVDGRGGAYQGSVSEISKKVCTVTVSEKHQHPPERSYRVTLAVAPTKNINRMEWLVEKTTEMGVDAIVPLITFHSERRKMRIDRLQRIMVAAMKQSQRTWLPEIHFLVPFDKWLETDFGESRKLMAYINDDVNLNFKDTLKPGENVIIAIGPEGGFSNEEAILAVEKGFTLITLGDFRLRTETAALVALQQVHFTQE